MVRTLAILTALLSSYALGQPSQGQPTFEVATVKPTAVDRRSVFLSNGRLTGSTSLIGYIRFAYGVEGYQILGGPSWASSQSYDIVAKAEDRASNAQLKLMLQTLLADRFQLKLHHEMKDLPVYSIVIAKGGPRLKKSAAGTEYTRRFGGGHFAATKESLAHLANWLSIQVGDTVLDMTGLTEDYDITLDWGPTGGQPAIPDGVLGAQSNGFVLSGAMEDQLGLKLEPKKLPTNLLVIDHAEKPSEN
jgi:bla regulator protein blaR1